MQTSSSPHRATRTRVRRPLRLALTLTALVTGAVGLCAQTLPPVAYWTFDEGTGNMAHEASGNGHDATLQGGAGWTTGIVGPFALSLPGAAGSYADVPTDVVDTTRSYTVAAWVKL